MPHSTIIAPITSQSLAPQQQDPLSSWFLGPKAENHNYFSYFINSILQHHRHVRENYFKDDKPFITTEMQNSLSFQNNMQALSDHVQALSEHLGRFSIPFWSPRYNGHMAADISMPALLGYFTTMLHNQNNVSFDGGPLTTQLEIEAGEDLCRMLGYHVPIDKQLNKLAKPSETRLSNAGSHALRSSIHKEKPPTAWGHITCDGSVANLESIWAARNLKHYPVALRCAMNKELAFIADTFEVETCKGERKLFKDLDSWELLNLKVPTVLGIPEALVTGYHLSSAWLDGVMKLYTVQSVGLAESLLNTKPIKYLGSITKHYSWPKGCAIAGIGSGNWEDVEVDFSGRLSINRLRSLFEEFLENRQAVYAVVAILGSTQEGAVDPLEEILQLRTEMQAKGLSFVVHCDAAWGGYFTTTLDHESTQLRCTTGTLPLKPYTIRQLLRIGDSDSVTIDPHKSGYIPFPAGGLCYRDGRMRFLVTWTSPVICRDDETRKSLGVYAVEGSKPGAAAVATWLSNKFIGLKPTGYGRLLGQAIFNSSIFAAHWATIESHPRDFIVIPFKMLPGDDPEDPETPTHENPMLDKLRLFIRSQILTKTNTQIRANPKAMELLCQIGSDLNINTFSCNFRLKPDGEMNDDLEELNYFNSLIIKALTIDTRNEEIKNIPVFLMGTTLLQNSYEKCLDTFKKRLGIKARGDLTVLTNSVLSPFTTENGFVDTIMSEFKKVVDEKVKICRNRNTTSPAVHRFVIQGTAPNGQLYLVALPRFHMENHRKQLIVTAKISKTALEEYMSARDKNPNAVYILQNTKPTLIQELLEGSWQGIIRLPSEDLERTSNVVKSVEVTEMKIIKQRGLRHCFRDQEYPATMPFYLYGNNEQIHMNHMLLCAPNVMVSLEDVMLTDLSSLLPEDELAKGMILFVDSLYENTMQPISCEGAKAFFRHGSSYKVTIYQDFKSPIVDGPGLLPNRGERVPVATGTLVVKGGRSRVFCESENLNKDGPMEMAKTQGTWSNEVKDFVGFKGNYEYSEPLPTELREGKLSKALDKLEKRSLVETQEGRKVLRARNLRSRLNRYYRFIHSS